MPKTAPVIEVPEVTEEVEEEEIDEITEALEASGEKEKEEEVVEEKAEEEEIKEEVKEKPPEKEEDPKMISIEQQNKELRQLLREQRKQMAAINAKLDRVSKAPLKVKREEDNVFGEEEEEEEGKEPELSKLEMLQRTIDVIGQQRGPMFEVLVEAMENNPKYNDIRTVCTREHFDDLFEQVAKEASVKEGKNYDEALLEVEASVWSMPNPYKYMYGLVKEFHPDYEEDRKKAGEKPEVKVAELKEKKIVKAPTSIAEVGGGGASSGGWTAKRIDDLPEDELDKVPQDIYDKYLKGQLK